MIVGDVAAALLDEELFNAADMLLLVARDDGITARPVDLLNDMLICELMLLCLTCVRYVYRSVCVITDVT
jgi:hypothetical protein